MNPTLVARLRMTLVLVVAILVQTTLVADLRIDRVAPDLLVLVAVSAGLTGGALQGSLVGFAAGLASDVFLTDTPMGLSALTLCLVGFGIGLVRTSALSEGWVLTPLCALAGTAAAVVLFVGIGNLIGDSQLLAGGRSSLIRVAVIESVWNAVLALPVHWVFAHAARGSKGAEALGRGRPDRLPIG